MKDSGNNDAESLSIYRYLMTIARRDGVDCINVRLIISDGSRVAVLNSAGNRHFLPHKSIEPDADGYELSRAIRYTVDDLGLYADAVKYLGSRGADNGFGSVKYFDFEVSVKRQKTGGLRWLKKSELETADIPVEEKRVLRGYFRREKQ